jgi:hypothetical protein
MKTKTKKRLQKLIGELEMIQNELETQKEYMKQDAVGNCVDDLTKLLSDE